MLVKWRDLQVGDTYEVENEDGTTTTMEVIDVRENSIVAQPQS